jgi:dopamine beta-monooxygenase
MTMASLGFLHLLLVAGLVVLGLCGVVCDGYPVFLESLPNGVEMNLGGIGHEKPRGGGKLNPFGLAFSQEGKRWTVELCEADSDGDGQSNGFELGDPQCIWVRGEIPDRTVGLSNPGDPTSVSQIQTDDRDSL